VIHDGIRIVVNDGPSLKDRPSLPRLANDGPPRADLQWTRASEMVRCSLGLVPNDSIDRDIVYVAEARDRLGNRLEDVCGIRGGGRDDPEHLGGCRLLLQGLVQLLQGLVQRSLGPNRSLGGGGLPLLRFGEPCLKPRDPRVEIVRHRAHPGHPALLRDGARIARGKLKGL
jgi:hypothetical protein